MTTVRFESKEYPGNFTFDRIFEWGSTQQDVFDYAASSIIEDVMRGYNGTIFAYGQTGSGKTFTMMGDMENEDLKGLTPRLVESIFNTIYGAPSHLEFTVRVSYMEIYMEKIRDLLNPTNDNLPIHEEKSRGVYVKGCLEVFVGSVEEVYEAMRRGQAARVVAYTNMNAESSRSHSIFVIQIHQKNLIDGSSRTGKLYLVDLAGSEKVGKTGATGQTLEEAKKINKSLTALGMVINALTDGKSSHIPYRDSKLTRILQESLGGNSRTTLIINCSPSSFNEAETVSTLRFGMRAKTIKNKAKVNAELSSAELKNLLKKAKADMASMQSHIASLQDELGGSVPKDQWTPLVAFDSDGASTPLPSLPDIPRSMTPAPPVSDDEREEFLKRENELSDQLQEKDQEVKAQKAIVESINEELAFLKAKDAETAAENKKLAAQLAEIKVSLEKVTFENKEASISLDTVKDANSDAQREIEMLKAQIQELQAQNKPPEISEEEREKKKQEKMAQMMAEFVPSEFTTDKEKQMRDTLSKLAYLKENAQPPTTPEEIEAQHRELLELRGRTLHAETEVDELTNQVERLRSDLALTTKRREEVEGKLETLEKEYEELLDKTIAEEEQNASVDIVSAIQDLKSKLENQYATKKEMYEKEIEDSKTKLQSRDEEATKLQAASSLETLKRAASGTPDLLKKDEELEKMRKTMSQQLGEFDTMKKKLMRDLQNRCEKVVELEISLDETREQYNSILRNSNSRAQQQKMAFLERNLEQLTNVQKQLVEQNSTLKKELAVAERKLVARSERIGTLESLLQDAQSKLELQNTKYEWFEAQLAAMREKLQEARSHAVPGGGSAWFYSSRIAKPLRGGGAAAAVAGEDDADSPLDLSESLSNGAAKRSSWYISLLKK
ncbi:P-loop containing nucleoside triphosphate hydrolase protein [Cladochytrium replicatum]|nr:P-loop containing nucleoside triphosphate hydrolase protein [Cladochytrium replicatum]